MVQTSSAAVKPKTLECHNGLTTTKTNSIGNNNVVPTTMTLQNPTMLSQTQTRARVREIETCSNAACHPANECLHSNNNNSSSSSNSRNNSKLLQQRKIHLTKSDNEQNNANTASKPQQSSNNSTTKPQGHQNATTDSDSAPEASNKAGNNSCTTGK